MVDKAQPDDNIANSKSKIYPRVRYKRIRLELLQASRQATTEEVKGAGLEANF